MSIPTLRRPAFRPFPFNGDCCDSFAEIAFNNSFRRDSSRGETDSAAHLRFTEGGRFASSAP
jgi:hypothetical protein